MFGVISLLLLKVIQVFIQLYNVVRLVVDLNENANKHTTFLFSIREGNSNGGEI
ncbi:hypothetical protein QF028_001750 [Neobacillus sp. B4I6]